MSIPRVERLSRLDQAPRGVDYNENRRKLFNTRQTAEIVTMDIMVAPLKPGARRPEDQRAWKWFTYRQGVLSRPLTVDCQIVVDGIVYLIDSIQNWKEAGYRRYLATENVTGVKTMYPVTYLGNGNTGAILPESSRI